MIRNITSATATTCSTPYHDIPFTTQLNRKLRAAAFNNEDLTRTWQIHGDFHCKTSPTEQHAITALQNNMPSQPYKTTCHHSPTKQHAITALQNNMPSQPYKTTCHHSPTEQHAITALQNNMPSQPYKTTCHHSPTEQHAITALQNINNMPSQP